MSIDISHSPTTNTIISQSPTPIATSTVRKTAPTIVRLPPPGNLYEEDSETCNFYPVPVASYEDVVQNVELFMDTLKDLHRSVGTKFMVPIMGGKALDLHRLFVEVTLLGGLEKVIRDRKWKDAISVFKFPSTITNASFVLRKYYIALLHRYEEVYYFRKKGQPISINASAKKRFVSESPSAQAQVATPSQGKASVTKFPVNESPMLPAEAATPTQEKGSNIGQLATIPELHPGCLVSGTIDGKFDLGYLVTVNLGSEKMKGVLYHIPPEPQMSQSLPTEVVPRRRHRKKSRLAPEDPSLPKPSWSGYNFFFAERYAQLKPLYYGEEKLITKKIAQLWSELSEAEKQVYQEKGSRDKVRYQNEMLEYRKSFEASKQ